MEQEEKRIIQAGFGDVVQLVGQVVDVREKSEKLEIIVNQVKVGKRVRNIADPDNIRWLSLQYPVQLSGTPGDLEGWEEKLLPGKQVKMACSFRLTEPAKNPGEFDAKLYYRSKGVVCTGYIKALKESSGADQPFMRLILWFRRYCSHVLEEYGGKEDSSIYKAMLLGDTSFMETDTLDLYRSSGIAHLLAVSGVKTLKLDIPLVPETRINWAFVPLHIAIIYILKLCLDEEIIPRCRFPCSRGYLTKCINWQKKQ